MGRKPKDLSGQKFGMLTVKDMTKKEMVEVQSIGIVYVTVGMKLMYQRQDLYKEHVIVVVACRKKNRQEIAQRRHLVDGTCVEVLEKRTSRRDNMGGFRGVFKMKDCDKYRVDIGFKGKRYYVGLFDNYDEAVQARLAAENLIHNGFI